MAKKHRQKNALTKIRPDRSEDSGEELEPDPELVRDIIGFGLLIFSGLILRKKGALRPEPETTEYTDAEVLETTPLNQ